VRTEVSPDKGYERPPILWIIVKLCAVPIVMMSGPWGKVGKGEECEGYGVQSTAARNRIATPVPTMHAAHITGSDQFSHKTGMRIYQMG